ncbi:HD domain-containing protein [Pontibacter qinzhouensis]|uniref:HD domain-containing protein n=1 Tax=Pontibacter qinzhouensis TaxID=2603253 RepID=A0A5C8K8N1_9BACT|nr:HD domain-containing protein [Pontibacter qinzhouensis]TXK46949.1 HD domain-containing protein [Pontibacter qinzhouensis]
MPHTPLIQTTANHIQSLLSGEGSGHDWWHVYRVWQNAKAIANNEQADLFIVELAALLHDIADHKFHNGDDTAGPRAARAWLESLQVEEPTIQHICLIIKEISYKGAGTSSAMSTLEGRIVQDADRLDAIGAIGIGRAFAFGGHKGREMYNPDIKPVLHENFEAYKTASAPTINHFYEKLLLLKDRMHTKTAKAMAEERHQFMEAFLKQFYHEWDGL